MSNTTNLALPYLAAGQAQKHVTLNESLRALDALVQMAVISRASTAPPASPVEGARYLVPAAPAGAFATHAGQIAAFQDGGWQFYAPRAGWLCWVADEGGLFAFNGSTWVSAGGTLQNVPLVGINASADSTNRLTVSSSATLLNHVGNGHQLKINKAAAGDTASLLFQSNWSGRAEMGLAGNDSFSIKLSPDGANWTTVLSAFSGAVIAGPNVIPITWASGQPGMEVSAGMSGDRYSFFDFHASDTQADYSARLIRDAGAAGSFRMEDIGAAGIRLQAAHANATVATDVGGINRHTTNALGIFPGADNAYSLGGAGWRWSTVWAANGVIQTSDQRDKAVERRFEGQTATRILDDVAPVLFRWTAGATEVELVDRETIPMEQDNPDTKHIERAIVRETSRPGKRLHAGFLAQDVKSALDGAQIDFSVWGLEDGADPESRQWLRPDQLIPVLWAALRETRAEMKRLASAAGGKCSGGLNGG